VSDSPLTEWALDQIKKHGAEPLLGIGFACVGVGYLIGWAVTLRKTTVQIEKLKEEARKASGENTEKLAQMRATALGKRQNLDMAQQTMRDALIANNGGSPNVQALRMCRDEMCNIYANDYLPALTAYLELIPRLVDEGESLIRAKSELIPGLETICLFLEMVNHEGMLRKINGSERYKVNRDRNDGLLLRVKTLIPWWRLKLRWKIMNVQKRINHHLR